MSGSSGYTRKTQLKLPPLVIPADSESVTFSDLQRYMKAIQDWADSLQFGFVGFNVNAASTGFTTLPVGSTVIPFTQVITDSNNFTRTDNQETRYFTVPPGCGGMYTISWSLAVSGNRGITQNFTFVSAAPQTFTVPGGASYMTVTCRGGTNRVSLGAAPGTAFNRTGSLVVASFDVIPGSSYDVYVPNTVASLMAVSQTGQYPGGGNAPSTGLNIPFSGSGYAGVRPAAGAFTESIIIAGAPGGEGGGVNTSRRAPGGNANGALGGNASPTTGDGLTNALFEGFGASQIAGGAAGGAGGTAGSAGQGGAGGGLRFDVNCEIGGGGGAGWFGGGGAGNTIAASTIAGGGGAGSSFVAAVGSSVTYTAGGDTSSVVNGSVSFTTFVLNGIALVELHVIRAEPRDSNLQASDETIAVDRDYPYRGSVVNFLGEGDRIYLRVINGASTNRYLNNQSWLSAVRSGV